MRVALATTSMLAANAGQRVAAAGGNACDIGIAAALMSANTEPGVCALAGGGYVTLGDSPASAVTFDGNVAVPGLNSVTAPDAGSSLRVSMAYGGGIETLTGAGSIAVPGTLAALAAAWRHAGSLPWEVLFEPVIEATANGFPLSSACHYYLQYSCAPIFSGNADSRAALLNGEGMLKDIGDLVVVPGLADTLTRIAKLGADDFYRGETARLICDWVSKRGGSLTADDLDTYVAIKRRSVQTRFGDWSIASNPPPAIGGSILAAMLIELERNQENPDTTLGPNALLRSFDAVLQFRDRELDQSYDLSRDSARLLGKAKTDTLSTSASTVHTSAVDENGLACAITLSAGYGCGEIPPGTGLWMNNCLGEIDLNHFGLSARPIGRRLISNMAPTVAFSEHAAMAIGSPGASRITTALCQVLNQYVIHKQSLCDAIAAPRAHLEYSNGCPQLSFERGFDMPSQHNAKCYETMNMYFGGVGATLVHGTQLEAAADPRRSGGTYVSL